jgi:hypothetical protein
VYFECYVGHVTEVTDATKYDWQTRRMVAKKFLTSVVFIRGGAPKLQSDELIARQLLLQFVI